MNSVMLCEQCHVNSVMLCYVMSCEQCDVVMLCVLCDVVMSCE